MGTVSAAVLVALDPHDARELWLDTRRWPTFVEGFARVVRRRGDWPAEGGVLEWESGPSGRGRVREQVRALRVGEVVAEVFEERLRGTQTATFRLTPEGSIQKVYRQSKGPSPFLRPSRRISLEQILGLCVMTVRRAL